MSTKPETTQRDALCPHLLAACMFTAPARKRSVQRGFYQPTAKFALLENQHV